MFREHFNDMIAAPEPEEKPYKADEKNDADKSDGSEPRHMNLRTSPNIRWKKAYAFFTRTSRQSSKTARGG